jgi:hypothetical protein
VTSLVVVQNNPAVDRLTGPVSRHARGAGIDLLDLDLREGFSFADSGTDFSEPGGIALFGSVGFLRAALLHPPLAARVSWSDEAFSASAWADRFGQGYLGHGGAAMPASDVGRALEGGGRLAVRPEIGLKGFAGGVYDAAGWRGLSVPPGTECFAAAPSDLHGEHRVWFVGGRAVAASRYRAGGGPAVDGVGADLAMAVATELAGGALPLADVVVDVAETAEGWRIVELNCIHTAGWYAAGPGTVLDALLDAVPSVRPAFRRR